MPTFRPPLAQWSEITTGEASPFVRVTFSVTLDGDSDGQYQLWTDLPDLNNEGQHVRPNGEWHEIAFIPVTAAAEPERAASDTAPVFTLPTLASPATDNGVAHYANFLIPAEPATYSYTLREVKQSGEIIWLGSGGNNGTVVVKHGENQEGVIAEAGPWKGVPADLERVEWTGVSVGLGDNDVPVITHLPHAEALPASLTVGLGIKPIDSLPFAQSRSSAKPESISRSVALAVAGSVQGPLNIAPSGSLPETGDSGAYGRSEEGSLSEAISKALAEQTEAAFEVASSSESHVCLTPRRAGDAVKDFAVVLAYHASNSRIVELGVPRQIDPSSPVLAQLKSARQLLNVSGAMSKTIIVTLEKGLTAEVLRFTELSELRGEGTSDSVWICAPAARTVQVGEEELSEPVKEAPAEPSSEAHLGSTDAPSPALASVARDQVMPGAESSIPSANSDASEQGELAPYNEVEDEDDTASTIRPIVTKVERFWLFQMIDSIFYGLWSWLLRPFQTMTVSPPPERQITDAAGQDAISDEGISTPVTERTPLLSTPGLSRSPSTTDHSALASPESSITIRATRDLDSFVQAGKDKLATSALTSSNAEDEDEDDDDTATIHPVKIRSYTQFTFASAPPFTFFLPAQAHGWEDKLKFSYKPQTQAEWTEATPKVGGEEGGAVELVLEPVAGTTIAGSATGAWDVQVERV